MNLRMPKGRQCWAKVSRCVRTVYFMVALVVSLLVMSLPVLVALGDVLVPCVLISSFTCISCYSFKDHLNRYAFKSSLTDIPLVSVVRSLVIICVYSMCDGAALSNVGTVSLCSFLSILLLSVKSCIFTVNSQIEAEASSSLSRKKLHLKKSWGMPVLFLSSVVFALGHIVIAYRTSCRARRKLLLPRVDSEVVLSCKNVFYSNQKVPRSPTPSSTKTPKTGSEQRQKPFGTVRDEEIPIRLLGDVDSLFITCCKITVHYKLRLPCSPPFSLSSMNISELNSTYSAPSLASARTNPERYLLNLTSKSQQLHRSSSNQFQTSSLYAPLLDRYANSLVHCEGVPVFSFYDVSSEDELSNLHSTHTEKDLEGFGQFGIVLVHGFGGGVFSWRHVMGTLSQQLGCSVVAFDRPGWGLSSRPRREDWEGNDMSNPYQLETQVGLLLSFCLEMGFSRVVLVGHDDGGLLALKAAQKLQTSMGCSNAYDELCGVPFARNLTIAETLCRTIIAIKGVVLLNVSLTREVVPSFARIILHTSLGKKHLVRPLLRTEMTQVVNRHAWYDATKLTSEILNLYKAPLYVEGWDEALHEIGKVSYETVLPAQNAKSLLEAVKDMPVLVVAGAENSVIPLKMSQALASKLGNSRLVAISGCGHLPHEECPKALLAAMIPFISRLVMISDT